MAYTTIDDPSEYFHTQLYTGNGSSGLSITNDANAGDFQADLLWIMPRSNGDNGVCFDSSRGEDRQLKLNGSDAEDTHSPARVTFESDGFDLDTTDTNYNGSSRTYVAWQWKITGGSRTTFSESGSNAGGGYQVNTTAGISIVDYTGTGSSGATITHGLGATPEFFVVKGRSIGDSWTCYHHKNTDAPETDMLKLDEAGTTQDNVVFWNDTAPTSSVFTVDGGNGEPKVNQDGETYISYAFRGIQGYSKFGSYIGNGNANGPFIYTGFKPAWVLVKASTGSNRDWRMIDNKRDTYNLSTKELKPNDNAAEGTSGFQCDLVANGFKIRTSSTSCNDSETYIYLAFAEHPFVSSEGIPCTAR